ncbi:aspartate carbamoyltransferase catalytic subunit [Salisediminibacterium halotolerans]|uniref:Aspartate carbamoyltransferase n=1 Tax=Salisediminibacterium halotolerans TaxID=517425 RepID=A0A1H9PXS4_9BACI|nr:aspartate carbamoyltransferase catalytic subunit [Salisediminibacterium haloalkalitolerans]SER52569.1 aspartate carbamoyltransferase catalytic subunit [Salisediminibacterium haloalkalitolerans]
MKNLLTLKTWPAGDVDRLLHQAEESASSRTNRLCGDLTVANLFFEPSTRTKSSFEMAQKRLGLASLCLDASASSVQKGESLYDTAKTMEAIGCDALVIRHPERAFYEQLSGLNIPIVNAGDGSGDHPTQSLLDLLTIKQEFGQFKNVHVVIAGDIKHSRVARTNIEILNRLGAHVSLTGPEKWLDDSTGAEQILSMDEAAEQADVLMLTRVQTERHQGEDLYTKADYHRKFGLTLKREKRMKRDAIIMHPAPVNRGAEIAGALVEAERSRIFKQMQNGVHVRKAVLQHVLELENATIDNALV